MVQTFSSFVDEWTQQSERRMLAVFKRSVELLADEMGLGKQNGGNLPWVTGNLARSILAELNGIVQQAEGPFGQAGDVGAKVAMAKIGDFINIGWQAGYAARTNYGFVGEDSLGRNYNVEGSHFLEKAASVWPQIVQLAAEDVRRIASL